MGKDDEKSSAFPFKFMIQGGKNKASRILEEIERSLGEGKGTAMMIIKSSASARGMYEIDIKSIDGGKGRATAAFRVYKAYLTFRAIVSCKGAWREENEPLIAQVMRHLFKGKSALYGAEQNLNIKKSFQCEDGERPVDLPLILNPSPLERGNRELRNYGGILSSMVAEKATRIKRVDHKTHPEGGPRVPAPGVRRMDAPETDGSRDPRDLYRNIDCVYVQDLRRGDRGDRESHGDNESTG